MKTVFLTLNILLSLLCIFSLILMLKIPKDAFSKTKFDEAPIHKQVDFYQNENHKMALKDLLRHYFQCLEILETAFSTVKTIFISILFFTVVNSYCWWKVRVKA